MGNKVTPKGKSSVAMAAAITVVLSVLTFQPVADGQADELSNLKRRVLELERKVERLEKLLPAPGRSLAPEGTQESWRGKDNWRRLSSGMTRSQVEDLLGRPGKIVANEYFIWWFYPNGSGGRVEFSTAGRVTGWTEP